VWRLSWAERDLSRRRATRILNPIGAVLEVVSALISRKKVIEHRVGAASVPAKESKGRGKKSLYFILLIILRLILSGSGAVEAAGLAMLIGIGGAFYQITRWFFD
jgi:hypothetical protein